MKSPATDGAGLPLINVYIIIKVDFEVFVNNYISLLEHKTLNKAKAKSFSHRDNVALISFE